MYVGFLKSVIDVHLSIMTVLSNEVVESCAMTSDGFLKLFDLVRQTWGKDCH